MASGTYLNQCKQILSRTKADAQLSAMIGTRMENVTFRYEHRSLRLCILSPSTWICSRSDQMIPPFPGFTPEEPGYSARVCCPQRQNGHRCRVLTSPNGRNGINRGVRLNVESFPLKSFVQRCASSTHFHSAPALEHSFKSTKHTLSRNPGVCRNRPPPPKPIGTPSPASGEQLTLTVSRRTSPQMNASPKLRSAQRA